MSDKSTCNLYNSDIENNYYCITKIVRLFENRQKRLFDDPGYLGVMCPYCNKPLVETYSFYNGSFRLNLSCKIDTCGFGFNSLSYEDLIYHLNRIEQLKNNVSSL